MEDQMPRVMWHRILLPGASECASSHARLHKLAEYVVDHRVDLLDSRSVLGRGNQRDVAQGRPLPPAAAGQNDGFHAKLPRLLQAAENAGGVAGGADAD